MEDITQPQCLLTPANHPSLSDNLNGPCVVEVPNWVPSPLGRYYLYFAHHQGSFVRLAHADHLNGPWKVHEPGVLHLHATPFIHQDLPENAGFDDTYAHIASPNVHIDRTNQQLVMFYHGLEADGSQCTRVCFSYDGLSFGDHSVPLADPYFAGFTFQGAVFGITWGGRLFRGDTWTGPFESVNQNFANPMVGSCGETPRHFGVELKGEELSIYFTRIGDAPERIFKSTCMLGRDWKTWRVSNPIEVLRPSCEWEGVDSPIRRSEIGTAQPMEHALRDPYPFNGHLFYAAGGESAIGVIPLP